MRKIILSIAAALAMLALTTGCVEGAISTEPTPTPSKTLPPTEVTEDPEPVVDETTEPPEVADPTWGDTFEYEDGTKIVVSKPQRLSSPGDGITWDEWEEYGDPIPPNTSPVKITMSITAGENTIDPSGATMTVLAGDEVLDAECFGDGVNCYVELSALRPGRTVKLVESYFLPDRASLTVEAAPSWEHESALYGEWE